MLRIFQKFPKVSFKLQNNYCTPTIYTLCNCNQTNSWLLANKLIPSIIESKQFLESDNPGSTDSEILRILTLHIPITEYDTLGSESDNDVTSRNVNQAKYRQRGK